MRGDSRRLKELRAAFSIALSLIESDDLKEVSNWTGLSVSTLRRVYAGTYSLNIRYNTVSKIAAAAGLVITMGERIRLEVQ